MKSEPVSSDSMRSGHEPGHLSLRTIIIIAVSVVGMVVLCLAAARLSLLHFAKNHPMQPVQALGILTAPDNQPLTRLPAPSLELDDGHADFVALRQRQLEALNSYAWVDRTNGIVRIPIGRAIDLIAARGLPVTTNSPPNNSIPALLPHLEKLPP